MMMKGTEARAVEDGVILRTKKSYPFISDQELEGDGEVESKK